MKPRTKDQGRLMTSYQGRPNRARFIAFSIAVLGLYSASSQACSVIPQNNSFSLDQFDSRAKNTVELSTELSLRFTGDCAGEITVSFAPRHWVDFDERPTIYIETEGRALYNSIVGGLDSLTVGGLENKERTSIPLRIVADVSNAKSHFDVARDIEIQFHRDSGLTNGAVVETSYLSVVEGGDPDVFPEMAPLLAQAALENSNLVPGNQVSFVDTKESAMQFGMATKVMTVTPRI